MTSSVVINDAVYRLWKILPRFRRSARMKTTDPLIILGDITEALKLGERSSVTIFRAGKVLLMTPQAIAMNLIGKRG
jgi:hypothetical protein